MFYAAEKEERGGIGKVGARRTLIRTSTAAQRRSPQNWTEKKDYKRCPAKGYELEKSCLLSVRWGTSSHLEVGDTLPSSGVRKKGRSNS